MKGSLLTLKWKLIFEKLKYTKPLRKHLGGEMYHNILLKYAILQWGFSGSLPEMYFTRRL